MKLQGYKDRPENSQVLKAFVGFFTKFLLFNVYKNQIFPHEKILLKG